MSPRTALRHLLARLGQLWLGLLARSGLRRACWLGLLAGLLSGLAPAWAQDTPTLTLRVGVYANPPKIFLGPDARPSGLLGDVLQAVAASEGWRLIPVSCAWDDCLHLLQTGAIDLMPDVAYSEARAQQFDFHRTPALNSWSQLYKARGLMLRSVLDLRGLRIAVVQGSVQSDALRNLLNGFAIDARLIDVASFQLAFEAVAHGLADVAAANRFFGDATSPGLGLEPSAVVFQPALLFYAAPKGRHPEVLAAIDRHLQDWQARTDSPYAQALARWLHTEVPTALPPWLAWSGAAALVLLLAAALALAWMRRTIASQTAQLRANEAWLAGILNNVDAYIYIKDLQRRYVYVNARVADLFGRPNTEVVGQSDAAFFDADTCARLQHNDDQVLQAGERIEREEVNQRPGDAEPRTYLSVKLPLREADGRIYALCGISTDITRHKRDQESIHRLAFYDPLTELPNRRLLLDRLELQLRGLARKTNALALLLIDLDHFKDVNDTLGHDVGDALLKTVAQRIAACIRGPDTLSRQGGDEFVVLLSELGPERSEAARAAQRVADKILSHLHQPVELGGHMRQVGASIGVALAHSLESIDLEDLLKQADLAMYQAKAAGRDTVRFFDPTMQAQVLARTSLEADLRWALQAQEFVVHYQPQNDEQGQLLGYEALVRWQHPMRGLVGPGEFIAVAESCGLIMGLGDWVLRRACAQLAAWRDDPLRRSLSIAVNVSAPQLRLADFVDRVRSALQDSGAPPERLELELTESLLVDDVTGAIEKMAALKKLGVRLSLDDFGTGYSSLAMLKRLPLDQLKIDISFVRDMLADARSHAIVYAIVRMGQALALDVIAEGVERPEQRDALRALGCTHFQGYLFGRPGPLPEAQNVDAPTPPASSPAPAPDPGPAPEPDPAPGPSAPNAS